MKLMGLFENWKIEDFASAFRIKKSVLDGVNIVFAYYDYEDYEGWAFVLFKRDGKLFEVIASHCSCHGIEGQWEPEETTVEAVRHRVKIGELGKAAGFAYVLLATLEGIKND